MDTSLPVMFRRPSDDVLARAARVRLLALDVDGVLTDGTIWYGDSGESLKPFNILDGLGLRLLLGAGIAVALITARDSNPLRRRAADLGIPHVHTAVKDKLATWKGLLADLQLDPTHAAFMGDDLIDLPVLRQAGLALTVPNAHPALQVHAHWCAEREGGGGAVREACELILAAQGSLQAILERYGHA
jgi:3-deoxy-D-manno-octulosonate 8-phosphate phosphatase (KDO 8-P phosphatase)